MGQLADLKKKRKERKLSFFFVKYSLICIDDIRPKTHTENKE